MSLKVAVTGNIGSGKTLVCKLFEELNVPVFYADLIAKDAYQLPAIKIQMIERFGAQIYSNDGVLNKKRLADHIFNDADSLAFVEERIHPEVKKKYSEWLLQRRNYPFTIYEAAILFEKNRNLDFDCVIYISAPEHLRLARIMLRDHTDEASIRLRMQKQWPDEVKIPLSHFVILNDGKTDLSGQVKKISELLADFPIQNQH